MIQINSYIDKFTYNAQMYIYIMRLNDFNGMNITFEII